MTIFRFVERLNGVRAELNILDGDIKAETARFSEDIKYFAEFTTGLPFFGQLYDTTDL